MRNYVPQVIKMCSYLGRSSNAISIVDCVSDECIRGREFACDSMESTVGIVWRSASWKSYVPLLVERGSGLKVPAPLELACASVSCDGGLFASMSKRLMSLDPRGLPLAPWHNVHEYVRVSSRSCVRAWNSSFSLML